MTTRSFELVYLTPERVHFDRCGHTLQLTLDGETHYSRVVLRSCFPVSNEQRYLSVRDANDEEEPEIGVIEDWTTLNKEDRQAVAAELDLHYFVPLIRRVLRIKEELGFLYWTVETDKGPKEFVMHNNVVRDARLVGPGRWLLIDVNQARYEIHDLSQLDKASRRWVQLHLSI